MTTLRIVAYLQQNPTATNRQIADDLGVSQRTVRRRLNAIPGLPGLKLPSWALPEGALRVWVGVHERKTLDGIVAVTGLSRATVMRGLRVLKDEGLVTAVRGRYEINDEYEGIGDFGDPVPALSGASVAASAQYFYEQCRSRFPMIPNQTNKKSTMIALARMRKEHGITYDMEIAAIDAFFARGVIVGHGKPPLWRQFLAKIHDLISHDPAPVERGEPVYEQITFTPEQYQAATMADLDLKDTDYDEYMRRWQANELEVQKLDSATKQSRGGEHVVEQ